VASVRPEKDLDLVATLMDGEKLDEVERVGIDQQTYSILGHPMPHIIIPVRPGRDLARLVEVAALDQKLKSLGHNAAQEFNQRLIERMKAPPATP
jgi:HPr kinase/phosphorylase